MLLIFSLLLYIADNQASVVVDWELMLPLITLIAGAIPFCREVVSWIDSKLSKQDEKVEALAIALQELSADYRVHKQLWGHKGSQQELEELEGLILRIDAKLATFQNSFSTWQRDEIIRIAQNEIRRD